LSGNELTGSLHVEGTFIIIVVSTITKKQNLLLLFMAKQFIEEFLLIEKLDFV